MSEARPAGPDPLAALVRRDRVVILAALVALTVLAWAWLARLADRMGGMDAAMGGMATAMHSPFAPGGLALSFAMWWVMMVGMMAPSAAPMILTFAAVNRRKRGRGEPYVPTAVFAGGYLLAWGGFSALAALAQAGLEQAALMLPMAALESPALGGAVVLAAGLYQLTPLKSACLARCRSPLDFVLNHWRDGAGGALRMGIGHGAFCLGCCWVLMALLFVGGVMNLAWAAAIAAVVLAEKLAPARLRVDRVAGVVLAAAGLTLLATA